MNNQLKSCLILIESVIYGPKKYSRQSLMQKLQNSNLNFSNSAITRILNKIYNDFGMKIKLQNEIYQIVEEESEPHYHETYNNIKSLFFREIIYKNIIEHSLISQFILFGNSSENKGLEHIEIILNAILEQKKVDILYQKFSADYAEEYTIQPVFIKEYQNRWYVISQNDTNNNFLTFAFDRIQKLNVLQLKFKAKKNNQNLYKNTIGVSYSEKVENVILKFDNWQSQYIKTLPLHSSQKIISEDDDGLTVCITVNLNYELEQVIKSYGSAIEIIEPQILKQNIVNDIEIALKKYAK